MVKGMETAVKPGSNPVPAEARPKRVLLIEDNLLDVRLIGIMLQEAGNGAFDLVHEDRLSKGKDRLARGDAMLDDPVDRSADQRLGTLRTKPGRDRDHTLFQPQSLPLPQRIEVSAAYRDLADVKLHTPCR